MVPAIGTRYRLEHGRKFFSTVEYIGPNPDAEFPTSDAHLIRTVQTPDGKYVGNVSAIDVLWFSTHANMVIK